MTEKNTATELKSARLYSATCSNLNALTSFMNEVNNSFQDHMDYSDLTIDIEQMIESCNSLLNDIKSTYLS